MANQRTKKAVAVVMSLSLMANASPQINAIDQIAIQQNFQNAFPPTFTNPLQSKNDFSINSIEEKISYVFNPVKNKKSNKFMPGICGPNLMYTFSVYTGELKISGYGEMFIYDKDNGNAPWYSYRDFIKSVTIENGVTSIGSNAFLGCSGLTSITIPDSVTSIGSSAFEGCKGLTSITIPDSVTSIGGYAFSGCDKLTSFTFGKKVKSIGDAVFLRCHSLTSITIPGSAISLEKFAFSGCSGLTSINVDKNNMRYKSIDGVLYSKDGKTLIHCPIGRTGSISVPDSVTSIDYASFWECSRLTSITIPDSVTSIGSNAFKDCSGLTSVTIGNGITNIHSYAFSGCSSLTSVTYKGTSDPGASFSNVFSGCNKLKKVNVPESYKDSSFCGLKIKGIPKTALIASAFIVAASVITSYFIKSRS